MIGPIERMIQIGTARKADKFVRSKNPDYGQILFELTRFSHRILVERLESETKIPRREQGVRFGESLLGMAYLDLLNAGTQHNGLRALYLSRRELGKITDSLLLFKENDLTLIAVMELNERFAEAERRLSKTHMGRFKGNKKP
jgi:hypothetical protein